MVAPGSVCGVAGFVHAQVPSDLMMCALVLCIVCLLTLLAFTRRTLAQQWRSVMSPASSRLGEDCAQLADTGGARAACIVETIVMSVALGVLLSCFLNAMSPEGDRSVPRTVALFYVYILCRRLAAMWVNWTFWPRMMRQWRCSLRLTTAMGAALMLFVSVVFACNGLSSRAAVWAFSAALVPLLLVKLWVAWKLFFGKMVGAFHFLLYFCTLELLPLSIPVMFLTLF